MRAIDQVAERAAQDQREAVARQPFVRAQLPGIERDRDQRERGNPDHHRRLVREVRRVEQAERRAGVLHVREVEHVRDDRHVLRQRQHRADEHLVI